MRSMHPGPRILAASVLLSGLTVPSVSAVKLEVWTSSPTVNIHTLNEPFSIVAALDEIAPADVGRKLTINVSDFDKNVVQSETLTVGAPPSQKVEFPFRKRELGWYSITCPELPIAAKVTKPAGFSAFAIVKDAKLPSRLPDDPFFGMQGTSFVREIPDNPPSGWQLYRYFGIVSALSGGGSELTTGKPDVKAQYEAYQQKRAAGKLPFNCDMPAALKASNYHPIFAENVPPSTYDTPAEYEKRCEDFFAIMAGEVSFLPERWYQMTWEPNPFMYLKGRKEWDKWGQDPKLMVEHYKAAWTAIRKVDPQGRICGPTFSGGLNDACLTETEFLFQHGLAKYLDGFSLHAYNEPKDARQAYDKLRKLIRKYAGHDLPLFVTESSFAARERNDFDECATVGAKLAQMNVISKGCGVKRFYSFYLSDYVITGEKGYGFTWNISKNNFGTAAICPKPGMVIYRTMSDMLTGAYPEYPETFIDYLGSGVSGVLFKKDNAPILVLYAESDTPAAIRVPIGTAKAVVTTSMGRASELTAGPDGKIELLVARAPVYVTGFDVRVFTGGEGRMISFRKPTLSACQGETLKLQADFTPDTNAFAGRLSIGIAAGVGHAGDPILLTGKRRSVKSTLAVDKYAKLGWTTIDYTIVDKDGNSRGVFSQPLEVKPALEFRGVCPSLNARSERVHLLTVAERAGRATEAEIELASGADSAKSVSKAAFAIQANKEKTVEVRLSDQSSQALEPVPSHYTIRGKLGGLSEGDYQTQFVPIMLVATTDVKAVKDDPAIPTIRVDGRQYVDIHATSTYKGSADLSFSFKIAANQSALLLYVAVTDDVFAQNHIIETGWVMDSLQVGLDPDPGKEINDNAQDPVLTKKASEFTVARTAKGVELYRHLSRSPVFVKLGLVQETGVKADVVVGKGLTEYFVELPWRSAGILNPDEIRDGRRLSFGLVVNDSDTEKGDDRKSIRFANGIDGTPKGVGFADGVLITPR